MINPGWQISSIIRISPLVLITRLCETVLHQPIDLYHLFLHDLPVLCYILSITSITPEVLTGVSMHIKFNIPEISEYAAGFSQYWLKTLFIQPASDRYQINALTSTYVRLVEAAMIEYHSGALRLKEYWGTHTSINLGAMHRAMSHFETCISDMYRATNCFRCLRRDRDQGPLSIHLNVRKANFATDAVANRFRSIRNEVHHLEKMVMDGRIANGQPFALAPNGPEIPHPSEAGQTIKTIDRLVIGSNEVKFSELAVWLTEMADFVVKIAEFLPNSGQGH